MDCVATVDEAAFFGAQLSATHFFYSSEVFYEKNHLPYFNNLVAVHSYCVLFFRVHKELHGNNNGLC